MNVDEQALRSWILERLGLMDEYNRKLAELDRRMLAMLAAPLRTPAGTSAAPQAPVSAPVAAAPPLRTEFRYKSESLLYAIQVGDGTIDFGFAARQLYGADSPRNRSRVSRLILHLQKSQRIKRIGPNTYKAI